MLLIVVYRAIWVFLWSSWPSLHRLSAWTYFGLFSLWDSEAETAPPRPCLLSAGLSSKMDILPFRDFGFILASHGVNRSIFLTDWTLGKQTLVAQVGSRRLVLPVLSLCARLHKRSAGWPFLFSSRGSGWRSHTHITGVKRRFTHLPQNSTLTPTGIYPCRMTFSTITHIALNVWIGMW